MNRKVTRWLIIAIILILASGIALTLWTAQREDSKLREDLLIKTRLVQSSINTAKVQALTGSEADLVSPDYRALKDALIKIRSADPMIRFIYLMGQRPDGTGFFFVDSEPPESGDYSPPGQSYPEASPILLNAFVSGKETTEGPRTDRWGTWVSGFVPVMDTGTGKVIALLGIDIDARDWNLQIITACGPAIIGTLLLLFLVLIFSYMLERNDRENQILAASESVIRESEERFRMLFEESPVPIFLAEVPSGSIAFINKKFLDHVGLSRDQVIGKRCVDLGILRDPKDQDRLVAAVMASNRVDDMEVRFLKKDGTPVIDLVSMRMVALKAKPYCLTVLQDVTIQKAAEEETHRYTLELQQHAVVLTEMNDKLNLLNSITRHDILNQLTVLIGYLEIMKIKFPDPALQEAVEREILAAHNIQTQIMFTKDYQDIGVQSPQWFDLRKVIASGTARLPLSQVSPLVHFDQLELYADPLLEKVFYNLMENALRHGKTVTTIEFSCKTLNDCLVVICQDNGMGIPAEYKEAIFERRFFKHTGFGLFLSRTILGITGITIRETGEPGKGARFEITVKAGAFRFTNSL
jgi:PAS domain S-box-containing protein